MATYKEIKQVIGNDSSTSSYAVTKLQCGENGGRGLTIIRCGFYYRNNFTSEMFANKVSRVLTEANLTFKVVDHGEVWKPFRGGARLADQTHWWVKID